MSTLIEVCELIVDCEHKTAPKASSGYPLIRTTDIELGKLNFRSAQQVDEAAYRAWTLRAVPQPGDLILAREAPVGNVGIIPPGATPCLGQRTVLLRPNHEKVEPGFLNYLLSSPGLRGRMDALSNGATVPHLNMRDIRSLELPPLPPLATQHRIASILSAYDDLIENNTRRIEILEDMAQAIYREWFVEFRFSGHEGVRMVDSELGLIPEGWRVQPLGDVVDVNARVIRGSDEIPEINYIDIAAVSQGEFGWKTMEYAGAPERARRLVSPCDVIWSTVRPNLQAFALICEPPPNCVASTGFAVLTAHSVPWSYLYTAVTTDAFVSYLVNHATGSAYPAVTGRTFEATPVVVPDDSTMTAFDRIVGPMYLLVAKLRSMSSNLRQTRDLLLPRLISGEIDVSDLDIGNAETAA